MPRYAGRGSVRHTGIDPRRIKRRYAGSEKTRRVKTTAESATEARPVRYDRRRAKHKGIAKLRFFGKSPFFLEAAVCTVAVLAVVVVIYAGYGVFAANLKININDVSELKVSYNAVSALRNLANRYSLSFDELLAVYLAENRFFPSRGAWQGETALERQYIMNYAEIRKRLGEKRLKPYLDIIRTVLLDFKAFPVVWKGEAETGVNGVEVKVTSGLEVSVANAKTRGEIEGYMYGDGFNITAGKPKHTGTDIYDRENTSGRLTVVSVCDGTVSASGYNRTDGYYIEILSDRGGRFYYCHLENIAGGLTQDTRVYAGQELGAMGGSGTACGAGGIDVRLHLSLRVKTEDWGEIWLNPYIFLRLIEDN